jgi:predicted dehydrogenase
MTTENTASKVSRRQFIKGSTILGAAALTSFSESLVHAAGSDELRVGLIGCGGRGTGAAFNILEADPHAKIVTLGDAFEDQLANSLRNLKKSFEDRVDVPEDRQFVGIDAYKQVVKNCDVVLLATPPGFRPMQIEAAVDAGIHIFAEKPVATDGPGLRRVMEACKKAEDKNLTIVSGFCYRYEPAKIATYEQIFDGAIGDIVALQCTYNAGTLWHRGRKDTWSDLEWQMRNWLYFAWLSGDHVVEQSCHSLDKLVWAMGDVAPSRVTASGGRIQRTDAKYGNIYDHFNSALEWDNGIRGFHSCRQLGGSDTNVSDFIFGSKGQAAIMSHRITGATDWRFDGENENMYVAEMKALAHAIHNNETINNGARMCESTLTALMVRNSAYTGKVTTRESVLNSEVNLMPASLEWGPLEARPVPIPGEASAYLDPAKGLL